jgi:predicted Zn-dependent protease
MPSRVLILATLCVFLAGCGSKGLRESPGGSYLSSVSTLHSEIDTRLSLALSAEAVVCHGLSCDPSGDFDARVARIGERLSAAAFMRYPDLSRRFEKFEFVVANKEACGTLSTAGGKIVLLRGVDQMALSDAALALILGREMAHVIAGHHEDNTLTSIAIAVAAQVLMPALNVIRGAASVAASGSLISSVLSFAGTKAIHAELRPGQLQEAEQIAFDLAGTAGFGVGPAITDLNARLVELASDEKWLQELRGSASRFAALEAAPVIAATGAATDANDGAVEIASLATRQLSSFEPPALLLDSDITRFNLLLENQPTAAGAANGPSP